ncbi:hypothetical protein [Mycolicibacterium sp.]|uniref:hypothetical protein n=1 Tax=Mycolicibacterium sp. TaxID=2320850 RepID=UPI0037C81E8E|nr:hypothetical protein [Mycobacterium sp. DSM 3803]
MTSHGTAVDLDLGALPSRGRGAHRLPAKGSVLRRTVAAGGAAVCIGAVADTPVAEALSIILPAAGGSGNVTQLNILEGNVINPQLAVAGSNVSRNAVTGNIAQGNGNDSAVAVTPTFWSQTICLAGTTGNGNITQVDIFSYNVINPQLSIGGSNTSANSSRSNVSTGNGNNSSTAVTSGGTVATAGTTGNGNTTQIAIGSGNIINPQWSLGGSNTSRNAVVGNVSTGNGNSSATTVESTGDGGAGAVSGVTGNGNTTQASFLSFNIVNPQRSFGGSNVSDNSTRSNVSSGNGNDSTTEVSGGDNGATTVTGTTGNGNTSQQATRSGQVFNRQVTSAMPTFGVTRGGNSRRVTETETASVRASGQAQPQTRGSASAASLTSDTRGASSGRRKPRALDAVRAVASHLAGHDERGPRHAKAEE